jgi:hypothetical protein
LSLSENVLPNLRPDAAMLEDVRGDGQHDDTAGLQRALDSRRCIVYLPPPRAAYTITRPLVIYSGQTLMLDRHSVVRLADRSDAQMLTNADHSGGNRDISVVGGVWDGNNAGQMQPLNPCQSGTYRYHVVSFTHHNVHPGAPSVFEDIVIDGVFCSKPLKPLAHPQKSDHWGCGSCSQIVAKAGALVRSATIRNLHRTEDYERPPDTIINERAEDLPRSPGTWNRLRSRFPASECVCASNCPPLPPRLPTAQDQ